MTVQDVHLVWCLAVLLLVSAAACVWFLARLVAWSRGRSWLLVDGWGGRGE